MNKIEALNDIVTGLGGTGGYKYEIQALNAWAVLVGDAGGYKYEIQALNAIDKAKGGTGLHKYNIDALNSICKAAGGSGVNKYEIQALAFIGSNVNPSTWDMLAPSALVLTVLSASSIRLNWTVNSVDRDGHKIERSTDGVSFTEVGSVLGATATLTDTGLTDWTTYYYRVRAFRGATYSPYCSIQNAKTWGLDFIITIDTTKAGSASNVFVFPLTAKTASNVTINWGDGNTDTYSTTGDKSHTYATSGVYQVKVGGGVTALAFNNTGDILKLMYIDNWGSAKLSSCAFMFYGCSNMQGRYNDYPDTSNVTNMSYMFRDCSAFNQSVSNFNTANVTNMSYMFTGCSAFNQSVSNFNTANVTSMYAMFSGSSAFNQSVSNFNTANVTNMSYMFNSCSTFNQSVSNFNTANVTNMSYMFSGCSAFNQSVSNFNTANVTNMSYMFRDCSAFNQSVSNFNTANVTNIERIFYDCSAFKQSVSNFDVSKVTSADLMFLGCNINATGTTTNYDNTLIAWANNHTTPNNLAFHGGTSKYGAGAGAAARATLISKGWTITDGGLA